MNAVERTLAAVKAAQSTEVTWTVVVATTTLDKQARSDTSHRPEKAAKATRPLG